MTMIKEELPQKVDRKKRRYASKFFVWISPFAMLSVALSLPIIVRCFGEFLSAYSSNISAPDWALAVTISGTLLFATAVLVRRFDAADGGTGMNQNSPLSWPDFFGYLYERSELDSVAKTGASPVIYDVGGTSQLESTKLTSMFSYQSYDINPYNVRAKAPDLSLESSGSADLCILSGVVEYLADTQIDFTLRHALRVLKPGAHILIAEGAFSGLGTDGWFTRRVMEWVASVFQGKSIRYRLPDDLERRLKACGFQDLRWVPWGFVARFGGSSSHLIWARAPAPFQQPPAADAATQPDQASPNPMQAASVTNPAAEPKGQRHFRSVALRLIHVPAVVLLASAAAFLTVKLLLHWKSIEWSLLPAVRQTAKLALDLSVAPLYRLVLAVTLVALVVWGSGRLKAAISQWFLKKWWDIGNAKPGGELAWADVFELASLASKHDPIALADPKVHDHPDVDQGATELGVREAATGAARLMLAVLIALGGCLALAIDYLLFPRVPALIFFDPALKVPAQSGFEVGHLIAASGNLTAYLALIAAVISIYFTYHQLRAKVRADSRQAWINEVRQTLSHIVVGISNLFQDGRLDRAEFEALNRRRLHLELMLNPAEKDHRLLTLLIRACIIPDVSIEGDKHVREQILKDPVLHRRLHGPSTEESTSQKLLWRLVAGKCRAQAHGNDTISYIVKLSHVVLKREWERVRHTR